MGPRPPIPRMVNGQFVVVPVPPAENKNTQRQQFSDAGGRNQWQKGKKKKNGQQKWVSRSGEEEPTAKNHHSPVSTTIAKPTGFVFLLIKNVYNKKFNLNN